MDNREKAEQRYNEQVELSGSDKQTRIDSAQRSASSAKSELDYAEEDLNEARQKQKDEDYSDIKDLKKAYDDAKKDYDSRYMKDSSPDMVKAKQEYETALSNNS